MKIRKRIPFKDRPLRYPGQSLDAEIERLLDKMDDILFFPAMLSFVAILEWFRLHFKTQVSLGIAFTLTIMATIAIIWTAVRLRKLHAVRRQLTLGRDGERVMGQFLEELREKGYRVLHDIVGEGFNIDHVVIAPSGIFTIETKTISKPTKGDCIVSFSGNNLLVNGNIPSRNPLTQARAQSSWIKEFLKSALGKSFMVRPTVIYLGWFVEGTPSKSDVWVLNEKALPAFIEKEPSHLSKDDLQAVTYHISKYIRATYSTNKGLEK